MQTEVTRLLGIEYPIIQGGMAWVAEYHLAAGVSEAGGLGLFRGDFFHAAAYLTFFLITNSTRDFLEPRLLGEKLGVYPIVIAVVVYVGICIFGPTGVLLGPLMLLVIREVVREWLEA